MTEEKKEKGEKLIDLGINDKNQLLVNGKAKMLKNFDYFEAQEDVSISDFDLDGIKKTKTSVPLSKINFKSSKRFQQRITVGSLKELVVSIGERGLLNPISVTLSRDVEGDFDCLDGFTRGEAISILYRMDSEELEKLGLEDFKSIKEFDWESEVDVLIYTKEDGTRIEEEDCYRIAAMGNTIRSKWNLIDIANAFKTLLRREIESKLKTKMDANVQLREHIETLFNGTPLIILNGMMHANILKASEISILKERVFKELEKDTGLSRAELVMYSRIAEIPAEFHPVLTGSRNQWGIILSPKNALSLFYTNKGQCKAAGSIEKILKQLKMKANPKGKGTVKVSGMQAGELADALSEEGSSRQKKINSTQRNVALMLLEHYAKKGSIQVVELPVLMDAYQNASDLEDFCEVFSTKTGIKLPKVEKFMVDRTTEEE